MLLKFTPEATAGKTDHTKSKESYFLEVIILTDKVLELENELKIQKTVKYNTNKTAKSMWSKLKTALLKVALGAKTVQQNETRNMFQKINQNFTLKHLALG